jgi:C-terminal processing protease CtpA/Prc
MTANKMMLALGVSLAAGVAAAAILLRSSEPEPLGPTAVRAGQHFDQDAGTTERLAALEAAVAEERRARQLLEEELFALYDEIDALQNTDRPQRAAAAARSEADDAAGNRAESRQRRARFQSSEEARIEALTAAGFSPDRAAWIRQREDELRVEAMQARFEAQRAGDPQAMFSAGIDSAARLRAELGDAEYGQFLEAYDRPTSVHVGDVLESSPGQRAGLQRGDEIVRYDGQRVFSYSDLNARQLAGEAGESVVVDILRDGVPMQVVMPRGPIGIEARRRWER